MLTKLVAYAIVLLEVHRNQPLKHDPWPAAQQEIFTAARAWASTQNPQEAVSACSAACERLSEVPGSSFVNFCESGREFANVIGWYLSQIKGDEISRSEILAELDRLELGYIEEAVVSDMEE